MWEDIDITALVSFLFGSGSIIYLIVQHRLKRSEKKDELEQSGATELKESLKTQLDEYKKKYEDERQKNLDLSIRCARLEERMLTNAKNKIRHKRPDQPDKSQ